MILPRFEYHRVTSLEEALALYRYYEGRSVFFAGGTEVVPRMKLRLQKPMSVIDLKGIQDLTGISQENGYIRVGALESLFELKQNPTIQSYFPALLEALDATSCETLQMRGTLGGNLLQETRCLFYNQSEFWRNTLGYCLKMGGSKCNVVGGETCFSNYCSDTALALLSLSAQVRLISSKDERQAPLIDLYSGDGLRPLNLLPGEILTDIFLPYESTKGAYEKLRVRGSIDYPLLGVAFSLGQGRGRLAIGAVGPQPFSYDTDEFSRDTIERLAKKASDEVKPVSNTVLSPWYRKGMVKVLAQKVMRKVLQEG